MKKRFLLVILTLCFGAHAQIDTVRTSEVMVERPLSICGSPYMLQIGIFGVFEENISVHRSIQPIRNPSLVPGGSTYHERCKQLKVFPLSESYASIDSSKTLNYRTSLGVGVSLQRKKWYNRTQWVSGWSTRESVDQDHAAFLPNHDHSMYWFNDVRTRTHYTPSEMLDVSFGIDNHFIGEGYRSLLQSNQNAPAPFAMLRANFWRLEYGLLYQFFHENASGNYTWKFNASHYLSWNATRNFNIMLVEQVFFQPKDGPFNRGFDVEYLNPIVFFRPQEYSLGSADNVVLGLQTSYVIKKHKIYGQLSLDEFVLGEIRARSRWWANKYGAQLGAKGLFANNWFYTVEGNVVRPYTYSHVNSGQNIGNLGLPLGHPLGSNFAELLGMITYTYPKMGKGIIQSTAFVNFQLKGFDEDTLSWGGDIYQSYVYRPKEYGNTIGQGITMRTVTFGIQGSYRIMRFATEGYVQISTSHSWGDLPSNTSLNAVVGIRSVLFQGRRFF